MEKRMVAFFALFAALAQCNATHDDNGWEGVRDAISTFLAVLLRPVYTGVVLGVHLSLIVNSYFVSFPALPPSRRRHVPCWTKHSRGRGHCRWCCV